MADYTVNATNVAYVSGPFDGTRIFGEAINAGQSVVLNTNTNTYFLASSNTVGRQYPSGVALGSAAINTPGQVALIGAIINPGFAVTSGLPIWQSKNNGMLAPTADLANTWAVSLVMVGYNAVNRVKILLTNSGAIV